MGEVKVANFIVPGIASIGATIVTNPLEVRAKNRLSLTR